MASIGSFTKSDTGFSGSVKTLTLNVKAVFRPEDSGKEKGPDYRIFAAATDYAEGVIMLSLVLGVAVFRGFGGDIAPHNNGAISAAPCSWRGAAGADQRDQIRVNSPSSP